MCYGGLYYSVQSNRVAKCSGFAGKTSELVQECEECNRWKTTCARRLETADTLYGTAQDGLKFKWLTRTKSKTAVANTACVHSLGLMCRGRQILPACAQNASQAPGVNNKGRGSAYRDTAGLPCGSGIGALSGYSGGLNR